MIKPKIYPSDKPMKMTLLSDYTPVGRYTPTPQYPYKGVQGVEGFATHGRRAYARANFAYIQRYDKRPDNQTAGTARDPERRTKRLQRTDH